MIRRGLARSTTVRQSLPIALLLTGALVAAGCASARPASTPNTVVSAGSCAGLMPAAQFAAARVVFVGTMLPGPAATIGGKQVLQSPARVRVSRYLKGSGPGVVEVDTGAQGADALAEDGIQPAPGQRWQIYSSSARTPFATSICAGSGQAAGNGTAPSSSFVYVTETNSGVHVQLRSADDGHLMKALGRFGQSFTDNGVSVSPDRREVYVTLIGHTTLKIVRIDVATGRRAGIANGEQPAVSPDGKRLAFVSGRFGSDMVAVRDLRSGATRHIDVTALIGLKGQLLAGAVTWLDDGSDIVVVPQPVAVAVSKPARGPEAMCAGVPASAMCLIVVHVGTGRLAARRVIVSGVPGQAMTIAGDPGSPDDLLAAYSAKDRVIVDQVTLRGAGPRAQRLVSVAGSEPVAIDPHAGRLLYTVGHSPPALWVGALVPGHLVGRHRLIAGAQLGEAAW